MRGSNKQIFKKLASKNMAYAFVSGAGILAINVKKLVYGDMKIDEFSESIKKKDIS